MRSSRDVEDDRFYHEPSDADRARFFVDVPYFYEQAFDPTSGGQMKPGSFDERGYYQGGKYREDADNALNAYLDFINPIMPYKDTPEDMAFIQSFVDEKMKGMHPYNYYRGAMLDKLKDLPLSELGQMTRRGYTPHRELMRDMASMTPNPRTYHGFDAEEMFLPNKNIPLKNIPDTIRPIIEGKGKIPEMMLRNADAKTKRGFRDRGKRLASLEAAIEANRRASSMDNANLNVRENAIQSFLPFIPASFGPRPYSKNAHGNVPYARTSFYDYGAKPLHTFDEDDEASAVVMNEAFPEQWQLINRSEDSFETAWDFLSTLNKEFVVDDFCPKCQGTGDQDEYNWKRKSFECDKCDGKGRGFFDDIDDGYVLPIKEYEDLTDDDMNYMRDLHDREYADYLDDYLADLADPYHARTRDFGYVHKIPYFTRSEDIVEDVWTLMKNEEAVKCPLCEEVGNGQWFTNHYPECAQRYMNDNAEGFDIQPNPHKEIGDIFRDIGAPDEFLSALGQRNMKDYENDFVAKPQFGGISPELSDKLLDAQEAAMIDGMYRSGVLGRHPDRQVVTDDTTRRVDLWLNNDAGSYGLMQDWVRDRWDSGDLDTQGFGDMIEELFGYESSMGEELKENDRTYADVDWDKIIGDVHDAEIEDFYTGIADEEIHHDDETGESDDWFYRDHWIDDDEHQRRVNEAREYKRKRDEARRKREENDSL